MARHSRRTFPLRELGIFGLDHLDAVVLAALADARPLLLIGPHGTAKSELLNRLAGLLGLEHRHYNASLLSFDDLLGYPVPDRDTGELQFLKTPASIWGAQSVFLDEISRCRPETANKLFSIVHERRLQGIELEDLVYRWAAMNPPPGDGTFEGDDELYLGSFPLDPALADRFAWILEVPPLDALSAATRRELIERGGEPVAPELDLWSLVERVRRQRERIPALERAWAVEWVDALVEPLREAELAMSGRRARFLLESVLGVHAASRVLGRTMSLQDSGLVALACGIPHRAWGKSVPEEQLGGIHRLACSIAGSPPDDPWRAIRAARDPGRKLALALEAPASAVSGEQLSQLVADTLAGLPVAQRWALSLLVARHPGAARLGAPVMEMVAEPVGVVVEFSTEKERTVMVHRSRAGLWSRVLEAVEELRKEGDPDEVILGNLLYTLFARDEAPFDPREVIGCFRRWRAALEGAGEKAA